jgi:hypothetical protein
MKDLTGMKFGRLTVIKHVPSPDSRHHYFSCSCECGGEKVARADHLESGRSASCGCLRSEKAAESGKGFGERRKTHGHASGFDTTPTYCTWQSMKARCLDENHKHFKNYGGRGIKIYPSWMDFRVFLADMGERPKGRTIERIDNSGNYEPGNCVWATMKQQSRNKRTNRIIFAFGKPTTIAELAEDHGLTYNTLYARIIKADMSPEDAILL